MKKIKFLLAAAVLLSGFAVLSEDVVYSQRKDVNTVSSISSQKSAEAKVEDTNVFIKVVGVEDSVSEKKSNTEVPLLLGKHIAVQIVIDNSGGKEDWEVFPEYFKLKDALNNTFMPAFLDVAFPILNKDIVDAGDSVRGWITFEVPENTDIKSLKLRYELNRIFLDKPVKSGWIYLSAVK